MHFSSKLSAYHVTWVDINLMVFASEVAFCRQGTSSGSIVSLVVLFRLKVMPCFYNFQSFKCLSRDAGRKIYTPALRLEDCLQC